MISTAFHISPYLRNLCFIPGTQYGFGFLLCQLSSLGGDPLRNKWPVSAQNSLLIALNSC